MDYSEVAVSEEREITYSSIYAYVIKTSLLFMRQSKSQSILDFLKPLETCGNHWKPLNL